MASRDGGERWESPVRVNDDPLGNGKDQLFTWMAVDPADGSVNIVFLDRRDTEGTAQRVTVARSTDGGRTFANTTVDQEAFSCAGVGFYGDYLAVAAHAGRVVAAWPHCVGDETLALSAAVFRY